MVIIIKKILKIATKIYESKLYTFIMTILATLALLNFVVTIINREKIFLIFFDNIFILAFAIDYIIRLSNSYNKKIFIKENIIDLIALIPFNSSKSFFGIFTLIRGFAFLRKFKRDIVKFTSTNNFNYIIYITLITLILGSLGIHYTEGLSFSDAIWWSFVTITTVGYGDISPSTAGGRIIAILLMLIGIGFLSMLTGTISTYFINKKKNPSVSNMIIKDIKDRLDNFDDMTEDEIEQIYIVLKELKSYHNTKIN